MIKTYGLTHIAQRSQRTQRTGQTWLHVFRCETLRPLCETLVHPKEIDAAAKGVEKAGGKILDKSLFCPGEPYLFFKDLDGYEVEIAFELPTPVDPKPTQKK